MAWEGRFGCRNAAWAVARHYHRRMSTSTATEDAATNATLSRVEVRPTAIAGDPKGEAVAERLRGRGIEASGVRTAKVYLIEGALSGEDLERVCSGLLADPVVEEAAVAVKSLRGT